LIVAPFLALRILDRALECEELLVLTMV